MVVEAVLVVAAVVLVAGEQVVVGKVMTLTLALSHGERGNGGNFRRSPMPPAGLLDVDRPVFALIIQMKGVIG